MSHDHRETLRISLGPNANALTSHLCNLETYAVLRGDCASSVTHRMNASNTVLPRVVFLDHHHHQSKNHPRGGIQCSLPHWEVPRGVWGGSVEKVEYTSLEEDISRRIHGSNSNNNYSNNNSNSIDGAAESHHVSADSIDNQRAWFHYYGASALQNDLAINDAYQHSENYKNTSRSIKNNHSRTINWDEESSDDDEEEDGFNKEEMKDQRNKVLKSQRDESDANAKLLLDHMNSSFYDELHWKDYLLCVPPSYLTPATSLLLPQNVCSDWSINNTNISTSSSKKSYYAGYNFHTSSFFEDHLFESIRKHLEECDKLQGFNVTIDSDCQYYCGLGTAVLQELADECKSAGRVSILVSNSRSGGDTKQKAVSSKIVGLQERAALFQENLNSGLALHGVASHSDIVLPLDLTLAAQGLRNNTNNTINKNPDLFMGGVAAALALESATMAYRLSDNSYPSSSCGIAGYGMMAAEDYIKKDRLTFKDFVTSLSPVSHRYPIVELSSRVGTLQNEKYATENLFTGTSLWKEYLLRSDKQAYRRYENVSPGGWLSSEGFLSSYSFTRCSGDHRAGLERSCHTYFALSSSLRGPVNDKRSIKYSNEQTANSYVTSLIESMVQYNPERISASTTSTSLQSLIEQGYYWTPTLLKAGLDSISDTSSLSTLENSSRSHAYSRNLSQSYQKSISRFMMGFLSRDASHGLAPDEDDCVETLEYLKNLDDAYDADLEFDEGVTNLDDYFDDHNDDDN